MNKVNRGFKGVIDDHGQIWTNLEKLRAKFDTCASQIAFEDFIVRSMGYVMLRVTINRVEINLQPKLVAGPALAALLFLLEDVPSMPCCALVHDNEGSSQHIILPAGVERIAKIAQIVHAEQRTNSTVLRCWSLSQQEFHPMSPLVRAVQDWSARASEFDDVELDRLVVKHLRSRFILLRLDQGAHALFLKSVGRGLPMFARNTLEPLVGKPFDSQPDQAHAKACIESYLGAITLWEPVLQEVEATAFWPGHGRLRRRYTRLILPLRHPRAGIEVLSASMQCPRDGARRETV